MEEKVNYPTPEVLDNQYKFITYLIGSMEFCAEKDDGAKKRAEVEKELLLRNVYPINPVTLEASKTGMRTEGVKTKMIGWIASGNWGLFREQAKAIWKGRQYIDGKNEITHIPGDIEYVLMSNWITFTYHKGDRPCGSFFECGVALEHNIPIYLITNLLKKELPTSLLQGILVSGGEVFSSLNDYLDFIDGEYKLKKERIKMYKYNPKLLGSGIIECIPQTGKCPHNCDDCFFQSGRSYLEPLGENLPHIPTKKMAEGRVVRFNDGNDSNNQRELVEKTAKQYKDYFFNTAIPHKLEEFSAPVVLTLNPGKNTDLFFHEINPIPNNLMFVRFRTNMWNIDLLDEAVDYYTMFIDDKRSIPIVVTFMAYYTETISELYRWAYEWKQRTTNSYWCLKQTQIDSIMKKFKDNPYVYSCGIKGIYSCKFCGNCLRTYFSTKEKMRLLK